MLLILDQEFFFLSYKIAAIEREHSVLWHGKESHQLKIYNGGTNFTEFRNPSDPCRVSVPLTRNIPCDLFKLNFLAIRRIPIQGLLLCPFTRPL